VRILFYSNEKDFSILIEDDGHGIESEPGTPAPGEHIGLSIMQERAASINGEVTIESEPGEGTRVYLHFPVGQQTIVS
jgi:two-component system nitrate/nitrite sensor histidine kinase NarX